MANPPTIPQEPEKRSARIPLLERGDQLSRDEFERRYDAMPDLKKAELIEGEVYIPSPVRLQQHGGPHADLIGWMVYYRAHTPGVRVGDNCSIRLDLENEPQPDAALIVLPEYGGQAQVDEEGYIVGGPELLGEIGASSVSINSNKKARVYRRNEVREYIVWRVEDQAIDWYTLKGSQFERFGPDDAGFYRSEVYPGLWLDSAALIRGDMGRVLQVLQQGIATSEHAAFVAKLQSHLSRTF